MHKPSRTVELKEAQNLVEVGATYRHYKSTDMTYRVEGLAIWEATDEICVIYKALYGEELTFCRALNVWLEKVDFKGVAVPRFTKL